MSVLFLTKNKNGKYTRWASSNDVESFNKMVEYFTNNMACADMIIFDTVHKTAVKMSDYCKQMNIHIKWIRNEKGELIKNERI